MTPRLLFHAINGVGLGHQRRTALIAAAARDRGAEVLVVSEAHRSDALDERGLPHVHIPLLEAVFDRERGPAARRRFRDLVAAWAPHLVVHDTHFLREVVRELDDAGVGQAIVLRFTSAVALKNVLDGGSLPRMRAVLLPYDRAVFDTIRFPPALLASLDADPRVGFTGPVVDAARPPAVDVGADPKPPMVLVSAGAGGKPGADAFYAEALDVARRLRGFARFEFVLGPYSRFRADAGDGVRIVREAPALRDTLARYDVGVLLPGYNALHEAMAARLPAVVRHARGLYCEDPGPMLSWLEARGCVAVAHGRRSLRRRLSEVLADPARRRRMAEAWPDVHPAAYDAADRLLRAARVQR